MMARSTKGSNQRPDTLMQDRTAANSKQSSCNTRPDHTLGSDAGIAPSLSHVRFASRCPIMDCSRESPSPSDGITVRPPSQREFCNTIPLKADNLHTISASPLSADFVAKVIDGFRGE